MRGYHWFLDPAHRQEAIARVSAFTKLPPKLFESWLFKPRMDFYRNPDAMPDIGAITRDIRVQKELGLIKSDLDARKYAELSLLKAAVARLDAKK